MSGLTWTTSEAGKRKAAEVRGASHTAVCCVIGLGYVGLPTAAVVASRGIKVIGVDVNEHAVDTINQGKIHIVEPDLDMLVHAAVSSHHLRATTKTEPADVFMMAVPTPFKEDHQPDLKYVEAATRSIAEHLVSGNLIILESTSPVGTTEKMAKWLAEMRPDLSFAGSGVDKPDVFLAHCPERILPGHVVRELVENDRIVGGLCAESTRRAVAHYRQFVLGNCLATDARSAELAKLVENSSRDVNIAFANELSLICDKLDISVWEVIKLANYHPRVNILTPGAGVGGHCIAVDPWFIVSSAPDEARLIHLARIVNDGKPVHIADKVRALAPSGGKIACLGLAYKANIDDLRESPAVEIVKNLSGEGYEILAVEPHVDVLPDALALKQDVTLASLADALAEADVIVVLVSHDAFKAGAVKPRDGQAVVDAVNLLGAE